MKSKIHVVHKKKCPLYEKKAFRGYLFQSQFFQEEIDLEELIKETVDQYNNTIDTNEYFKHKKLTRTKLEFLNTFIYNLEDLKGKNKTVRGSAIMKNNTETFIEAHEQIKKIQKQPNLTGQEVRKKLEELHIPQASVTADTILEEFPELSTTIAIKKLAELITLNTALLKQQNDIIISQNNNLQSSVSELKRKNEQLKNDQKEAIKILTQLKETNDQYRKAEDEKQKRREQREKAQKRVKRQPIHEEEYNAIIDYITHTDAINIENRAKYKLMACLLLLTGARINEILDIKIKPVMQLLKDQYIPIDRSKGGPKQHKAFINKHGQKLLERRKDDIQVLLSGYGLVLENINSKNMADLNLQNLYMFPGKKDGKPLSRPTFNNNFNKTLAKVPSFIHKQKTITSHSFRAGYITDLWKKTSDIELVRQFVCKYSVNSDIYARGIR